MVEEIVSVYTELHILLLGDFEVLENRHVPLVIGRPGDKGQLPLALSSLRRECETFWIDELMSALVQSAAGIARQGRLQVIILRTEQRRVVDPNADRSRNAVDNVVVGYPSEQPHSSVCF